MNPSKRELTVIFPLTYLHHLIAHPAEVSPFSGFLPQQVMCVAAESSLTIQAQGYSTHETVTEKRNSQDCCALATLNKLEIVHFHLVQHANDCHCRMCLAFCEYVPSATEAEHTLLHPDIFLHLKNKHHHL